MSCLTGKILADWSRTRPENRVARRSSESFVMTGGSPLYYWDTCLFLAWLKDEERPTGEMDGVREIIRRHKSREVRIMTSVLTSVEVLSGKIPVGVQGL